MAEFIVRKNSLSRLVGIASALHITVGIMLAVIFAALVPMLREILLPVVGEIWANALPVIPPFAAFAIPALTATVATRRLQERFGTRCPGCCHDLHACSELVIASRHCPHCGRAVIQGD